MGADDRDEEEEDGKGFRITDKRKMKRERPDPDPAQVSPHDGATGDEEASPREKVLGDSSGVHVGSAEPPRHPPIDFGNFVLSLAHSALVSMGLVEHPDFGEAAVDLDAASQSIEILEMMKQKTKGNLDSEEEKLLGSLLYELRMSFVDA